MMRPEDITRQASSNPLAREACEMLCEAFWTYVGSLVLTYGAWDGVILTGGLAHALRAKLGTPRMQEAFTGQGKYLVNSPPCRARWRRWNTANFKAPRKR